MSSPAIKVEELSKKFILAHESTERYTTIRDSVVRSAKRMLKKGNKGQTSEEFWALKDVSFEVKKGDRIGIIGRNGAGKSTLLKVLSRITEPSKGKITIQGRVASLLEVGTGFHPELTGRENIFLNGAILGMNRNEIRGKFDEIVSFAEVEKFLDTPVKRYSSGMYVRLAFAVAAHLEPEILVVDEVLAVGDAQFQKKCLGKMEDVSRNEGRTILFVSHQMDAIEALTNQVIYLKNGSISKIGNSKKIIHEYLHDYDSNSNIKEYKNRTGNGKARVVKCEIINRGIKTGSIRQGDGFDVVIGIECYEELKLDLSFVLENVKEQALFCTQYTDKSEPFVAKGYFEITIPVNLTNLRRGDYLFSMALFRPDKTDFYDVVLHFPLVTIEGMDENSEFPTDARWGDLYYPIQWQKK
jgi:ABC-type polysaccharide/polyol phosphate transport system ATPase subunit